jgi:phosphodiesterase/alkaline phosphatase D-like protein
MARMTIGPVIGKTTATATRVLVEADGNADVVCELAAHALPTVRQTRPLRKGRPSVFSFSGLQPETLYTLNFSGISEPRPGSVRTYAVEATSLNVAVVSCNNTPRRGDTDLWRDLFHRYVATGDLDLVLHVGDQVYGDRAFEGALRILGARASAAGGVQASAVEKRRILELYRKLYFWAWNHPPTRDVLANAPSLMIWDDHEIRDDWGSRNEDGVPGTPEYVIGSLARRVYREYQRQLWDDFDTDVDAPAGELEHHQHVWGPIGVLFVDQRGARSFNRDVTRPFLGTSQWLEITNSLEQGLLSRVRALIVVTSVPLAYLGTTSTSAGSAVVDDLKDHWSFAPHQKEQIEMLRALRRWKEAATDRELLVVGGDVHIGGETEVRHEGKGIFRQLISSAITNQAPPLLAYAVIRLLLEGEESLGGSYSFEHSNFTSKRNFGIVLVRVPGPGQRPRVAGTLSRAGG